MVHVKFGNLARDTRMRNRHPLKEVADGLRKSIVYISDIERGNRNAPPPQVARAWALLIGGDPEEFEAAALMAREAIELTVDQESQDSPRNMAALALTRTWDRLSPSQYRAITELLEDDDADDDPAE